MSIPIPLTHQGVSLRPLTPKQRAAVIYFFQTGGDKTEACKLAGYRQPSKATHQVFNHPQVSRVVEKIQRKIGRQEDLTTESVLQRLQQAVFRNIADFVDEEGALITNLNNLPPQLSAIIDGFEIEMGFDEETGQHYPKKIKYKTMPNAQALDMALKVLGAYAPEKTEQKVTLDWDAELEGHDPSKDDVNEEIEAEYERLVDHRNGESDG